MANKMLIDAAHPEETRVVVVRGQRVEEFDFESAQRKPLRGNIYLAKVMRVEPSLQAAFVDYGGNRHGFLAFSEIHPDYYQIPVADREALIAEEARSAREADDEEPRPRRGRSRRNSAASRNRQPSVSGPLPSDSTDSPSHEGASNDAEIASDDANLASDDARDAHAGTADERNGPADAADDDSRSAGSHSESEDRMAASAPDDGAPAATEDGSPEESHAGDSSSEESSASEDHAGDADARNGEHSAEAQEPTIEHFGAGDGLEEVPERRRSTRRTYKIQEVIKRRQILLVQVVKEERGNKGAALTTYLSLAGRYSVLMPNTARGGGISRKITNAPDRKRLKSVAEELDVPDGMGVIVRTAGAARTKAEIKRDFEYLLRLWENVREFTLQSTAPALVHEEGSLIKRAIRDLYNKDIDEVLVAGDQGYKEAKDFMRMLAPSHAKVVKLDKETEPVFARFGVEKQLDAMFSNVVTLRSGGYLVINQTEALVAVDVNSGRATREHNIEDTAFKTNLEAAEESARQMRLRDLAGLIVIDFIDMDEKRNNRSVEKRLKDCLKNDRARIQVGSISPFGLLEMSRQRIRSGVVEGSSSPCPHCAGAGRVRSTPSVALHVLRHVEDSLAKNASRNLIVKTRADVAFYVLNQKRTHLRQIEDRFGVSVAFVADDRHNGVDVFTVEFGEPVAPRPEDADARPRTAPVPAQVEVDEPDDADEAVAAPEHDEDGEAREPTDGEGGQKRKRRRRRRRGGERDAEGGAPRSVAHGADSERVEQGDERPEQPTADRERPRREADADHRPGVGEDAGTEAPRKRRRSRRGGRAHREDGGASASGERAEPSAETTNHSETMNHSGAGPDEPVHAAAEMAHDADAPGRNGLDARASENRDVPERASAHAERQDNEAPRASLPDASTASETATELASPDPALASTYDPAKAKRAGWWSKAKSVIGVKE